MSESHLAYLLLGSNIQPGVNLRRAIQYLKDREEVLAISTAWETKAVGAPGSPNFLNACVQINTNHQAAEILEEVIRPVETALGRMRSEDKYEPRPIDIDLVLFDDQPLRLEYWQEAFLLVPLAELIPDFEHPVTHLRLADAAENILGRTWIAGRPEVLEGLSTMQY